MDKKWLYLVRAVYIAIAVYLVVSVIVFHDAAALGLLLFGGLLAWVDIYCFEKAVFSKIMVGSRLEKAFFIVKHALILLLLLLLIFLVIAGWAETSAGVLAVMAVAAIGLGAYMFLDISKRKSNRHLF